MRCYRGVFRGCRTGHGGAFGGGHVRFAGVWGEVRQREMRRESSSPGGGGEGGIAILTRFLLERRLQNLLKEARIRVIVHLGVVG